MKLFKSYIQFRRLARKRRQLFARFPLKSFFQPARELGVLVGPWVESPFFFQGVLIGKGEPFCFGG